MDKGGDSVGGAFYSKQVFCVEHVVKDTLTCTFGAAVERAW
jgi:hypothetical protein